MASPKLTSALKDFANKISGTSTIDNSTDPTSALSMLRRKAASVKPPTPTQVKGFKPQP